MEVTKLNPKPTRVAEGTGWIHFRNSEGTVISCRTDTGHYKDLNYLLQVKGKRITLPDELDEVLARAMVFAKRDRMLEEEVIISIKDKSLNMTAKSDTGWFKEDVDIPNFKGNPIRFVITPYLLKGILSETRVCELAPNQIKFEGTDWIYTGALKDPKEK